MISVEPLRHIAAAHLRTDLVVASAGGLLQSSCGSYADIRMGTLIGGIQDEGRGPALSLRPRGREHSKDILCRNVTIYGHCRYEEKGCAFNHELVKSPAPHPQPESMKQRFNVDSPSFTPAALASNGHIVSPKSTGLSPKAAIAAPFKPKGITPAPTAPAFTPASKQYNPTALDWVASEIPDFIPQSYNNNISTAVENKNDLGSQTNLFEQFTTSTSSLPSTSHTPQPQVNPYAQEASSLGVAAFYPGSTNFSLPLQHHLYAALGPHRDLQPNQRTARDFFISEDLRQLLQKKSEATLHTLPHSNLPPSIAHFHGLVPLVSNTPKSTATFGYSSWIYKALSSQDGKSYCLRQLQGYQLTNEITNESAIRSVQRSWGRIRNANVVSIHLAFTTSAFGDSSLIFVTDYHPLSETLAQKHFTPPSSSRFPTRHSHQIPEQTLWSYIVQIASALKAIHSEKLAARVLEPNKVLLTGENRIRLNGCAILDVVQHDAPHTIPDLQRRDLYKFGRLILALGTNNMVKTHSAQKAWETFSQRYSPQLRERVSWLLSHESPSSSSSSDPSSSTSTPSSFSTTSSTSTSAGADISIFLTTIAPHITTFLDSSLSATDTLHTELGRELENSRLVRLLTKISMLCERPEYDYATEHHPRFILPIFRDYVFHQVDSNGRPVLDLAHVISCLNKVDVGSEERVTLTSRDENTCVVISFREIRTVVDGLWAELVRRSGSITL